MPDNKKPGNKSKDNTNKDKPKLSKKGLATQVLAALAGSALSARQVNDPNSLSAMAAQTLDKATGNNLSKPAEFLSSFARGLPNISDYPDLLPSDANPSEEITQARLRTVNAIENFNSTVEHNNTRNLSDEEKVKILAPLAREMQSATLNELQCLIYLYEVQDASGTQEEQVYYKNSKDFFLALLDNIPIGGTTGATVNFRQFSVYGTNAQPGWTTDLSAIKNGIINLNYQGGATLGHTGFDTVVKDIQDAKITPTASKPLVFVIRTDGKIQDEAKFAQSIANIRTATDGHVKFIVTYVEGVNEPVYGSIDTTTISKYLLPSDLVFSFYEPGAVIKALEAMTEIVQAACGTPPIATGSPTVVTTNDQGTSTPSASPTGPGLDPGLDPALAALICINILLCIPLVRPRLKFGPPKEDGDDDVEPAPLEGSRAARFHVEAADPAVVSEGAVELDAATHGVGYAVRPGFHDNAGGTSSTMGNLTYNAPRMQHPDAGTNVYEPAFTPTPAKGETWGDVWDRTSFELRASWAPIILAFLATESIYQVGKKAGVFSTNFDESHLGTGSKYLEPDLVKLLKMIATCCASEKNDNPSEKAEQRSDSNSSLVVAENPILQSLRKAAESLRSDSDPEEKSDDVEQGKNNPRM